MTHARFVPLLLIALAGCRHRQPIIAEIRPEQSCAGQLFLDFTNRASIPVQVGWLTMEQLRADPSGGTPVWLGVVGLESTRFKLPGPGRVIFRTANPAAVREDRHNVVYRLLCQAR